MINVMPLNLGIEIVPSAPTPNKRIPLCTLDHESFVARVLSSLKTEAEFSAISRRKKAEQSQLRTKASLV